MLSRDLITRHFDRALNYPDYLATGTDEQRRRWQQVFDVAAMKPPQRDLVAGFSRKMNVLVVSGIWCGDCVQQCPLMVRIAEANAEHIALRFVDRDVHNELSDQLRLNAGGRVPVVIFLAEDFEFCGLAGDRTLSRYRSIARRQLGPACPIAIGPPDADELAATLGEWLDEFERIHLMLRISPRLRQQHGD